jgi:hypothetical protein
MADDKKDSVSAAVLGGSAVGGGALGYLFGKYVLNLKSTPSLIASTGAGAALGTGVGAALSAQQTEKQKRHAANLDYLKSHQTILENATSAPALLAGGTAAGLGVFGGSLTDGYKEYKSRSRANQAIIDEQLKVAKQALSDASAAQDTAKAEAASRAITELELQKNKSAFSDMANSRIDKVKQAYAQIKQAPTGTAKAQAAYDVSKSALKSAGPKVLKGGGRALWLGVPATALTSWIYSDVNKRELDKLESEAE